MSQRFKVLVPIVFLFAIGAAAQTITTNTSAGAVAIAAPDNQSAVSAVAAEAQLSQPTELFITRLQSDGLVDHEFMRTIASLAPNHASTALLGCRPGTCTSGLVCCLCIGAGSCETRTQCNIDCQK